jgi:hypothetical protein
LPAKYAKHTKKKKEENVFYLALILAFLACFAGRKKDLIMNENYDFIIIGTGAGGGTLAHKLAPSGKKILVLERGDFVKRELENWNSRKVNVEGHYNASSAYELQCRRKH